MYQMAQVFLSRHMMDTLVGKKRTRLGRVAYGTWPGPPSARSCVLRAGSAVPTEMTPL